jgi:hypothetical protein
VAQVVIVKRFAFFLLLSNILLWGWQLISMRDKPGQQVTRTDELPFEQSARKLQLLSEFKQDEVANPVESPGVQISEAAPQEVKPPEHTAAPAPPQMQLFPWCGQSVSTGNKSEAAKFLDKWRQLKGSGEQIDVQEPVSSTWWVHLPPFKDEAEASRKMAELREKKIDSYYMRSGELAGGISLGVYSRKQSATQVQADLLKKGYKTELKEVFKTESRTRLELKLEDRSNWEGRDMRELLAAFQQLGVQEIPCK